MVDRMSYASVPQTNVNTIRGYTQNPGLFIEHLQWKSSANNSFSVLAAQVVDHSQNQQLSLNHLGEIDPQGFAQMLAYWGVVNNMWSKF